MMTAQLREGRPRRWRGARCLGMSDLFDSTSLLDHQRARVLCSSCPAMRDCLDAALVQSPNGGGGPARRVPDGTWGGLLWRHGRVVTGAGPS